jgi:hypothetical protein
MGVLDRYIDNLNTARPPGTGCHGWLLSTANRGVMAGLSADKIFLDLRHSIPQGTRRISDKEIADAVNKALADHNGGTYTPRPRPEPIVNNGKATLQRLIAQGKITDEVSLWEISPIRLWEAP